MSQITTNVAGNKNLKSVYEAKDPEELKKLYDEWAETFNADVTGSEQDYVAPGLVAQAIAASGGRLDGDILDAGCGTGLSGLALFQAGMKTIDGIDLSPGMLDIAKKTGVYRNLAPADLSKKIPDYEDNTYDVVTCVGTFTHGHVGPDPALAEFVRVVKKGGLVVATILSDVYKSGGYEEEIERLKEKRRIDIVSTEAEDYRRGAGVKARIIVLRKK